MHRVKDSQLIIIQLNPNPILAENYNLSFTFNSIYATDLIRISVISDINTLVTPKPSILMYSNLVNNYIGTVGNNYIQTYQDVALRNVFEFGDNLSPTNGMLFKFKNKQLLSGTYSLILSSLNGSVPTGIFGQIGLYIEYYI